MAPVRLFTVDEVTDQQVEELRERFLQQIQQEDIRDHVHPDDVRRAQVDNMWLRRYMAHGDLEVDKALDFMIGSVKFRHEWGLNDLTQEGLLREVPMAFEQGQMSVHTRDKDGALVLVFQSSLHRRLTGDDWRRGQLCLLYWVERIEREQEGRPISLFLDMGNAGLQNVDIPFIQFMIGIFKNYYPAMLSSIVVYEMPWIMNAVWKIIKQMLPPKAHLLIKFVSKKDISDIIPPEGVLERWGGVCDWQWHYCPKEHQMPPSPFLHTQDETALVAAASSDGTPSSTPSPESHHSPSTGSQRMPSLARHSQSSGSLQDKPLAGSSWRAKSQSVPSLLEVADTPTGVTDLPPPVPEKQARKRRTPPRQTANSFAVDSTSAHPPLVPVRRRVSRRAAPPPPPTRTSGAHQYQSILDLSPQVDARPSLGQRTKSESGDSGASCDDLSDQSQHGMDDRSDQSPHGSEDPPCLIGNLLELASGETVRFGPESAQSCRPVTLRCIHRSPVAFKVKTTAPDRFLVRPSRGVVAPGRTARVELHLAAGVTPQMALSERFLVVATPVKQALMTSSELEQHWKHAPASALSERRLRCSLAPEPPLSGLVQTLGSQLQQLQRRLTQQQQLQQQLVQQAASTRWWLVGTAAALAALSVSNVYLLLSGGVC